MKTIVLLLSLFFANSIICQAGNVDIFPILLKFKGVAANKNITVVYAKLGCALISRDYEKSWEQRRIFAGGDIINVFFEDNYLVAFNDRGEIAVSDNEGKSWTTQSKFGDIALAVVKYPDGYFIRMRDRIISLSKKFGKMKEKLLESKSLRQIGFYFTPSYTKSILFSDNKFIVEIDSSVFIRFDMNLEPVDTLKLMDHFQLGEYLAGYRLYGDSNYIYFKQSYSSDKSMKSAVFRTGDFKSIDKIADSLTAENYYSISNGKLYTLGVAPNQKLIDTTKLSANQMNQYFIGSETINNRQYILGEKKLLQVLDLKDSSLNVISDATDADGIHTPDFIRDGSYFFYSNSARIYKSENNGVTILPTVDKSDKSYQSRFNIYEIKNHYYDNELNKLYLFGYPYVTNRGGVYTSYDEGKTFDSTSMENVGYTLSGLFFRNNFSTLQNIQKRGDEFIFVDAPTATPWKTIFSTIATIKSNGKYVTRVLDTNSKFIFNYVYSKDVDSYLAHSCSLIDSASQIVYSGNGGKSWDMIHKYPINETIGDVYDIEVKGRKYMAFTHYDYAKYPMMVGGYLDIVDKETLQFYRVASWGSESDSTYGTYGIGLTSDGENAYISFQDTLFVTNDMTNKAQWNYHLLSDNGRMVRPLKKFGDKFYCLYLDDNHPYGSNMYWIKPTSPLILGAPETDAEIEVKGYLRAYPAYPAPATNTLGFLVSWDSNTDLNSLQIEVYNIFGVKIDSKDLISLSRVSSNSGRLVWDCSSQSPGVYLIKISNSSQSIAVKTLVSKQE